jgi:hypothetical protein
MSSVQQQLAIRAKRLRLNSLNIQRETSDRELLSDVFSQWRLYKFYKQLAIIQRFMRSFRYIIKMRILKKNHREPDSKTHSAHQIDRFIRMEQNRKAGISLSYDFKNHEWTRLRVFLLGFVKTHNLVVDELVFIQKMREMLNRDEFDYIQNLMESQSFIQFFKSTRKTRDDIYNGCSDFRSMRIHISGQLWILYYLSYERLPKSWFPNPESDFAFVFEKMRTILSKHVQEDEKRRRAIMESGPAEQPDYCPEPCSLCGSETIQGSCFDVDCMRRRESGCPACGNPIEGNNAVEVDGMRFHQDCANHNQHNSHFRDYMECSICGCSSNDMSFVEEFGLVCDNCISLNQ